MNIPIHEIMNLAMTNDQEGLNKICEDLSINRSGLGNYLIGNLPWTELTRVLPYPVWNSLIESGFVRSLSEMRAVDVNGHPIPWFTYPALEFLSSIVQSSWKVFEWGSGHSTIWWGERVSQVVSVEDDPAWARLIEPRLSQNVTFMKHALPEDYTQAISQFPNHHFDVIVIDGSHRNECALQAVQKLAPHGLIIFDNTDESAHSPSVKILTETLPLRLDYWGMIPAYVYKSCTSFFLQDSQILKRVPPPHTFRSQFGESNAQSIETLKMKLASGEPGH